MVSPPWVQSTPVAGFAPRRGAAWMGLLVSCLGVNGPACVMVDDGGGAVHLCCLLRVHHLYHNPAASPAATQAVPRGAVPRIPRRDVLCNTPGCASTASSPHHGVARGLQRHRRGARR